MEGISSRAALGRCGEELAVRLLARTGYRILARNWRTGRYEIDIIGLRLGVVAFVEVKSRRPGPQPASDSLTRAQRLRICRAAAAWMRANPGVGCSFRFDLVAVTWPRTGTPRVEHIPDAFDAGGF